MNFKGVLFSFLLAVSLYTANALPVHNTDDEMALSARAAVVCNPLGTDGVDRGIVKPSERKTVHVGKSFAFQYCSTSFKEESMMEYSVWLLNTTNGHKRWLTFYEKTQKPIRLHTWYEGYDLIAVNETYMSARMEGPQWKWIEKPIKIIDDWVGPRPGMGQPPPRKQIETGEEEDNLLYQTIDNECGFS